MGDIYNIPEVSVATSLMNYVMVEQTEKSVLLVTMSQEVSQKPLSRNSKSTH